jgi:uncharacterized protein
MLRLDLSRIRDPETTFTQVYRADLFREPGGADEGYSVVEPVRLRFDLLKTGERYRLVGGVQTALELPCSRCLESFRLPVDAGFDLEYRPQSANTGDGNLEVQTEDLSTAFYENDQIDLGQLVREQLYLALPMKPLCDNSCRGLCPVCGINLNRGSCACAREWRDPRLAELSKLQ